MAIKQMAIKQKGKEANMVKIFDYSNDSASQCKFLADYVESHYFRPDCIIWEEYELYAQNDIDHLNESVGEFWRTGGWIQKMFVIYHKSEEGYECTHIIELGHPIPIEYDLNRIPEEHPDDYDWLNVFMNEEQGNSVYYDGVDCPRLIIVEMY